MPTADGNGGRNERWRSFSILRLTDLTNSFCADFPTQVYRCVVSSSYIQIWSLFLPPTVPIIPEFLYDIRHPDAPLASFPKEPPTTLSPCEKETTPPYNGVDVTTPGYGRFLKEEGFVILINLFNLNKIIHLTRQCQLVRRTGGTPQGAGGGNGRGRSDVRVQGLRPAACQPDSRSTNS